MAAACFAGGCRWFSLREKDLPPAERLDLLRRLVALGHRHGAVVGVHEDVAAALAAGAGALHLPDGASAATARARLGGRLIGISAHDAASIARAAAEGADYATLSPIFVSPSKPEYPALGLAALVAAARIAALPLLALGGINASTLADAIAAGAAGVAVMGEAMRADDPARAIAALVSQLRAALAARGEASHSSGTAAQTGRPS
jgi:thiamine-phosphate pyrophosphorylase